MTTELTQPVMLHGDPAHEHNRLLGDHNHTGVPVHQHGVPVHQHQHGVPVQSAAVPVLVGAVPVVQAYAVPQQAGVVKHKHGPLKPLIALFLLALAVVLIGLLAFQAHHFFGGAFVGYGEHNSTETDDDERGLFGWANTDDDDDATMAANEQTRNAEDQTRTGVMGTLFGRNTRPDHNTHNNNNERADNVGFNGAGAGMFFFGILFAVLQAVTAITMWVHLAYYMPYLRHSSVMGPLKVTAAVGFIAMGFACRHISLGAREDTSVRHHRITHAIEAFIIINWFFVMLTLLMSLLSAKVYWDCENLEEHRITRRMTAAYTQFFLALVLIGLLAAYFQHFTAHYINITSTTEMLITFAVMFAVLQAISGLAMIQQCGYGAPGQMPETVHALLKVVLAFGIIALGFACRSIFLTRSRDTASGFENTSSGEGASAHLVAIQSFVIINFIVCLWLTYASSHGYLNWDNYNTTIGHRAKGMIFGVLQIIFSIVLFGLLAGLLQGLTGNERDSTESVNAAGKYMVWFGLLFAVLQFFAGCTMLESGTKKLSGLNPSSVSVTNKVALAMGILAFGFACRHVNLRRRIPDEHQGGRHQLVEAIEAFIIINFLLTWAIDVLCVKGKIEW